MLLLRWEKQNERIPSADREHRKPSLPTRAHLEPSALTPIRPETQPSAQSLSDPKFRVGEAAGRELKRAQTYNSCACALQCRNWGASNPQRVLLQRILYGRAEIITKALRKTKPKQTKPCFKSQEKMCLRAHREGHSWPWEWCSNDLTEAKTQARKCFAHIFQLGSWHPS